MQDIDAPVEPLAADLDVTAEFDFVDFDQLCRHMDCDAAEWLTGSLENKIWDLVNEHGYENIFGTSYWEGFAIDEHDSENE